MLGASLQPKHFLWSVVDGVATVTLNRPEKKNPLTFESYAELAATFRKIGDMSDVKAVVLKGAGGNFCSGGDVHEIIGPLTKRDKKGLQQFTAMTGELIIAMRECPRVIVAAIEGVCVGAGAAMAMASDIRFGTEQSKVAFLFVKVGLAGCDMGACSMLPRIIGFGRASELLYSGRSILGSEALANGFYNRLCRAEGLYQEAQAYALQIAQGPTKAHALTKEMLNREWSMDLFKSIEAEAAAQADCMQTKDFHRAYEAFVNKQTPKFEGD